MTTKEADKRDSQKSFNKKPRAGLKDFRIVVRNLPFAVCFLFQGFLN